MQQRRTLIVVLIVVAICLLCFGCAACGALAWLLRDRLPQPLWPAELTPGAETTATGPSTARAGGELRLSGPEPVTLDPAVAQDANSAYYLVEIYSGLVTLDADLEVVPDLAQRWEISADGRTYTFYLRDNARFQDGRAVTAADVEYSLERACSPELATSTASMYLGDIVGVRARLQGEADRIEGLRVIDERTIALTIDAPKAYFLAKLTYPVANVVDRANVETGRDWCKHPNGTGPFRLARWEADRILLEPNPYYYGGKPALERVVFVLAGGSPLTMYENDELDIVSVPSAAVARVLDPSNPLHSELQIVPVLDVQYLAMNVNLPPFDDVNVRRAIVQAIDRQKLADVVLQETVTAAKGILPPGMPGYREEPGGLDFDPQAASAALNASRYKGAADLPTITLHIASDSGVVPSVTEAIVAMLRDNLGIEVEVELTSWDEFLEQVDQDQCDFFELGWIADYADPENFIDILFHSGSQGNHTGYSNPEVDRLLEEARVEADPQKRLSLYQKAEDLILQDAVWVPLWHGRDYMLTKPYVKGAVYSGTIRPWLKDVYIVKGDL